MGAGKTSLLNHLLKNDQRLKLGAIINDFGEVNIDSMLVSSQTDVALDLSNSCICCSLEGENLDDAIDQFAHPGSRLDYIVVEASGLAESRELATMLRLMKDNYANFDALVAIVDGTNFKMNNLLNEVASAMLRRRCGRCVSKGWLGATPGSGPYAVRRRGWRSRVEPGLR